MAQEENEGHVGRWHRLSYGWVEEQVGELASQLQRFL